MNELDPRVRMDINSSGSYYFIIQSGRAFGKTKYKYEVSVCPCEACRVARDFYARQRQAHAPAKKPWTYSKLHPLDAWEEQSHSNKEDRS